MSLHYFTSLFIEIKPFMQLTFSDVEEKVKTKPVVIAY